MPKSNLRVPVSRQHDGEGLGGEVPDKGVVSFLTGLLVNLTLGLLNSVSRQKLHKFSNMPAQ